MDLPTLSVNLFGGFQIYCGETSLTDRFKPRLQTLIAYLLLHRNTPLSRQQLAFHFWPDSTDAQARSNLRKSVYRLRQIFPDVDNYLELEGATLSWHAGIPLQLDIAEFETTLETAEREETLQKVALLQAAIALYKGSLLPDFYDDWVLAARERLRRRYLYALRVLAKVHEQQRDYASAIPLVRQLLREDPLVEEAYRHLMRLQALSGNVAGALRTYHRCARQLEQELGVDPGEATQETYRRLLDRREPLEPSPARRAPRQVSLVGQEVAWQQLLKAWRLAVAGRPQAVLISGEAGIGKTRLAEELLSWTNRQGLATLTAACFPMETPLPLRPITDWLRSQAVGRALPALPSRWRSELARILPELLAVDPQLEMPRPMTEAWQQQHFFTALVEAVTSAGEPLLLFVDDLHWADADTLSWLHFLARQTGERRFLLLATVRSEEVGHRHPLPAWQEGLARLIPIHEIALQPLNAKATASLASHLLGKGMDQETANALHVETEGNPLFTVEMVRAGFPQQKAPLPDKVRSVIEIRLSRLTSQAQEVAGLAAVIGRSFDFSTLNAAGSQPEEEVLAGLDELWRRQIVREQEEHGYDFSHDKIRQVALLRLSPARRRWWHGRVAHALENASAASLESVYGQIAVHWEAAGEIKKAVAAYQRAGEEATTLCASDEALEAYHKALALLETHTLDNARIQRTQLLSQLGAVLLRTGRKQEAQTAFEDALRCMPFDFTEETRLHRLLGDSLGAQSLFEQALAAYGRAEAALPVRDYLTAGPESAYWIDIQLSRLNLFYGQGDSNRIQALMDEVGPFVERQGTSQQRVRFLLGGALLGVRLARYAPPLEDALSYSERALRASRESDLSWQTCHSHFGVGFVRLWRGEEELAEGEFETALGMAEDIGHEEIRLLVLTYLCVLNRRRNARIPAEAFARQSLEVARAGKWHTYIAAAEANLAWVAWRSGDQDEAWRRGSRALELWQGSAYPFQWLASWPLLDITLTRGEIEKSLDLAHALLVPSQQRLPDAITHALRSAVETKVPSAAQTNLEAALRLAREHRFL